MNDYCTLWPEGWWGDCCKQHDLDYLNQVDRKEADTKLLQCVLESPLPVSIDSPLIGGSLSLIIGFIMYIGVRTFGSFFYKKK